MGFNIQQLIEGGLQEAPRSTVNHGINPNNGLKTVSICNWIFPNYENQQLQVSFTVKLYSIVDENEVLVNKFEYIATAFDDLVDYEGNFDENGVMSEWQYFNYLRNIQIHIPSIEQSYATSLFQRGKFDSPKGLTE